MTPCRTQTELSSLFWHFSWFMAALSLFISAGCTNPLLRSQSPEEYVEGAESKTLLIGDVARAWGTSFIKIEGVALVTGLQRTGEDPAPSPQRTTLLNEMEKRGVEFPDKVLQSPNTALVLVRGFLPPGVQKGDHFDLEVRVPSRSETTSLRGGWLMETRMTEMAVMGGAIHDGHLLAHGEGDILVDPMASGDKDRTTLTKGRVLGGGTALKTRQLGLMVNEEDKSIRVSTQIGEALKRRFHTYRNGDKQGVAVPKTDRYIELVVHPRYKDNIARYMRVVRSVALRETVAEQALRLEVLKQQLLDPATASEAALRLEAIGKDAVKVLAEGLKQSDPEVRFYSAEALAYLDESQAAEPLGLASRNESAFRAYALTALSAMDDAQAAQELRNLLHVASAETRYGAFRSLWAMNPNDVAIRGENLNGRFSYHIIPSEGPEMVHVTRSFRSEVVLFGEKQSLKPPFLLEAGPAIVVQSDGGDQVVVSRFALNEPDQKRAVSTRLDDVIRAIVELGGAYPDVVQALQQAKASKALSGRLEVDAIPGSDREYARKDDHEAGEKIEVSNPAPDLFSPDQLK